MMSPNEANDTWSPRPEELAAYVDDELDPADRRRIRQWLGDHPEAIEEVRGQQRLLELVRGLEPVAPTAGQWRGLLNRVQADLTAAPRPQPLWRQPLFRLSLLAVGTAAALLLALPSSPLRESKRAPRKFEPGTERIGLESDMVRVRAPADNRLVGDPPEKVKTAKAVKVEPERTSAIPKNGPVP